jgi:ribulose 1,5-bisphosphate synthetase/thiazole synthase
MARRLPRYVGMDMNESKALSSASATQAPALEDYDLVILGDGTGATLAAWTFASQGQRVAVIERKYIGGSCPGTQMKAGVYQGFARFNYSLCFPRGWPFSRNS